MHLVQAILSSIPEENREHWQEALKWLVFTIVGSLFPVWAGALLLMLTSQPFGWRDFFRHGEFALYSAAILAPAIQLLSREFRTIFFEHRWLHLLVAVVGLLVSALLFSAVIATSPPSGSPLRLNQGMLIWGSMGLFLSSATFVFFVTFLDYQRLARDIRAVQDKSLRELKRSFKHTEPRDADT